MIVVHGRGGSPAGILDLFARLDRPQVAAIAPAAPGGTWYPLSFMAPREDNEPGIANALATIESLVVELGGQQRRITTCLVGHQTDGVSVVEPQLRLPRRVERERPGVPDP